MRLRLRRRNRPSDLPSTDQLMPPEGVPLRLPVARLGTRLAAQVADVLLTGLAALCLLIILSMLRLAEPRSLAAIVLLLFFVIRIPYYVFSELAWNGQTLGKRLMKIKVVAHDGGSLTAHALVLRNLMKEAEIFLPGTLLLSLDTATPFASLLSLAWVLGTLAVPLFDRYRRRLGDLMAGTHVVDLPQPVLLNDLAQTPAMSRAETRGYVFLAHQLDHYGAFELQTLESLLRAQDRLTPTSIDANRRTLGEVVERIRNKIGHADPVQPGDYAKFLSAFYNAQRAHLEQRQLFGDRRADKHHAENSHESKA